ncbi:hypothetical protein NKG05_29590 [Oerskovia sp. M15]
MALFVLGAQRDREQDRARGAADGAMFAVWNDLVHADYTQQDVHGLVELSFPTIAQKTWDGGTPELTFAQFSALTRTLGLGPGIEVVDFTRVASSRAS